jgi:hypothetical protein
MMSYSEMLIASQSDNPIEVNCARVHFIARLQAKQIEDHLTFIEKKSLAEAFNMSEKEVRALWEPAWREILTCTIKKK